MSIMKRYRSHKEVYAMKILSYGECLDDGSVVVGGEDGKLRTNPRWRQKFAPGDDLGYYVQYEDGYDSWSPSAAFEAGYSLAPVMVGEEDRMLKWFEFGHLPDKLQAVSRSFAHLAEMVIANIEPGPERTVALRKLLEAKDAAVRATVHPGG